MTGRLYVARPAGLTPAHRLVLEWLEQSGPNGRTAHEVAHKSDLPLSSVTARLLELRRLGLVVPRLEPRAEGKGLRPVKRGTEFGGMAQVWRRALVGESRAASSAAEQRAAAAELRRAVAAVVVAACELVDVDREFTAAPPARWQALCDARADAQERLRGAAERYRAAVGREAAAACRVTAPALEVAP